MTEKQNTKQYFELLNRCLLQLILSFEKPLALQNIKCIFLRNQWENEPIKIAVLLKTAILLLLWLTIIIESNY